MKEPNFTPDIFSDLVKLIQNVPIINAKLTHGNIDSKFGFSDDRDEEIARKLGLDDDSISIRDIVRLFTKFLLDKRWNVLIFEQRYTQLRELSVSYPIEYLLFDYCLAALEGDYLDAKLYLAHTFHILGLSQSFNLLLGVIINDKLTNDEDVRKFLTALAISSQPLSAGTQSHSLGEDYNNRYKIYENEARKLAKSLE